ncbi:MAG: hypothetical protein NXI04_13445 [Planctomycetaceae bacterium]|nr:hypothetical protein [Planctomycetaceae bacterium]
MAKTKNQRKKAVAEPRVQYSLARRVVLHFFVFICAGAIFGIINQFLMDPFAGVQANLTAFARQSAPLMLAMLCLIPIFVRDTLTLSNKIAGPIHNLRNTIKAHAEGQQDVRPLRFRKGDFWDDLPEQFNAMTDRFRQQREAAAKAPGEQELVEA